MEMSAKQSGRCHYIGVTEMKERLISLELEEWRCRGLPCLPHEQVVKKQGPVGLSAASRELKLGE